MSDAYILELKPEPTRYTLVIAGTKFPGMRAVVRDQVALAAKAVPA